ncbi:MAG: type II secretion system minor pseudopilin GspK [Burkholderiales bacterium]
MTDHPGPRPSPGLKARHPSLRRGRKERGIALVTALFVVALAATTATFVVSRQSLWAQQVQNLRDSAQAASIARAGTNWARFILAADQNETDHAGEAWAALRFGLPVENGKVSVAVSDAQALFNLNNLVREDELSEPDMQAFQRLLATLDLPPELALAVADSVDENSKAVYPGGAEDIDYLGADPPYRAPNRAFVDVDELIRVKGFDAQAVQRLKPFVTALPEPTQVNVNTAPAEVLAAVIPGVSLSQARSLVESRADRFFTSLNELKQEFPEVVNLPQVSLGVTSQHFKIFARAEVGRARQTFETLVARAGELPAIVWQKAQ